MKIATSSRDGFRRSRFYFPGDYMTQNTGHIAHEEIICETFSLICGYVMKNATATSSSDGLTRSIVHFPGDYITQYRPYCPRGNIMRNTFTHMSIRHEKRATSSSDGLTRSIFYFPGNFLTIQTILPTREKHKKHFQLYLDTS